MIWDDETAFAVGLAGVEGAVVSAVCAVVKLHAKLAASPLPDASFAAVVTVAVYCVLATKAEEGVNVAVLPLTFTVPETAVLLIVLTRVKLVVVSVEFVIASENVTDTAEFNVTPIAAFWGVVPDTVGGASLAGGVVAIAACD